ncbi:MAG: DUF2244 domain-containing protein [Pseudomonadota bacterium]
MSDNKPSQVVDDEYAEETYFSARLTPHRSLPKSGFLLIMLLVAGLALSSAVMFMVAGAWPVMIFLVFDVLIVFLAFQISYRSGKAYEDVTVTADTLTIKRVSPWGRVTVEELQPTWTQLKTAYDHEEERVLAIKLESKGQQVSIGAFMNPDDKESFALALGEALQRAKRGPVTAGA